MSERAEEQAMPSASASPAGPPFATLAGIIATVSVFAVSQGLSYPLLSFILQRQGISPAMIGLSAAMTPLGFIVSSLMIPRLSQWIGPGRLAVACAMLAALCLAAIGWRQELWFWFPMRFLLGFFANPLYVISETWMIAVTPAQRRARIMGVYTSVISGGFALGPLTLAVVGTEGWPPFLVGVGAFLLCGSILLGVLHRLPPIHEAGAAHQPVSGFIRRAPLLLFAVFVAAAFEQALFSLFAIYGEGYGSPEQRVSTLLAVFVAGNIALQVPFGAIAERIGAHAMMAFCAIAGVAGCILLPLSFETVLIWPVAFVWGAVAFGIYTMALIQLGERFSGTALITGNAAFALFWGVGGIGGPPVTGAIMDAIGIQGLPLSLGLICAVLAGWLLLRRP